MTVYTADSTETVTVYSQNSLAATTSPAVVDVVTVQTQPSVLSIIGVGARGPAGPPGTGGTYFTQSFAVASDTWTVNHNLGIIPAVGLYDSFGRGIQGHVESNTETTTVVTFYNPVSGRITLS